MLSHAHQYPGNDLLDSLVLCYACKHRILVSETQMKDLILVLRHLGVLA